jgi:hypothetical protein
MGSNKALRASGASHFDASRLTGRSCRTSKLGTLRTALSRGSRSTATGAAAALAIMLLAGCASTPVVTAVDSMCVATSRPSITEAQRAAFRADQATWEPLVDWLASFIKVRDGACLKTIAGP